MSKRSQNQMAESRVNREKGTVATKVSHKEKIDPSRVYNIQNLTVQKLDV